MDSATSSSGMARNPPGEMDIMIFDFRFLIFDFVFQIKKSKIKNQKSKMTMSRDGEREEVYG